MRAQVITDGPDVIDNFVVNGAGTTVSQGRPIHLIVGASCDGKSITIQDTLNGRVFLGVANRDIAINTQPGRSGEFARVRGRVLAYIYAHGTSVTIGAGSPMGPGAAASNGFSSTGLKNAFGPLVACDTIGASICSAGGTAYAFATLM